MSVFYCSLNPKPSIAFSNLSVSQAVFFRCASLKVRSKQAEKTHRLGLFCAQKNYSKNEVLHNVCAAFLRTQKHSLSLCDEECNKRSASAQRFKTKPGLLAPSLFLMLMRKKRRRGNIAQNRHIPSLFFSFFLREKA